MADLPDGSFQVACGGHRVTATWQQIIDRYKGSLEGTASPQRALGSALGQFGFSVNDIIQKLRDPSAKASQSLSYIVEQFAEVDHPNNPLKGILANAPGRTPQEKLANYLEQRLKEAKEKGGDPKIGSIGTSFAMEALAKPITEVGAAATKAVADYEHYEATRPRLRSGTPKSETPPAPEGWAPCGGGAVRFGMMDVNPGAEPEGHKVASAGQLAGQSSRTV